MLVSVLALAGSAHWLGGDGESAALAEPHYAADIDVAGQIGFTELFAESGTRRIRSESVELSPTADPSYREAPIPAATEESDSLEGAEPGTLVAHAIVDEVVAYRGPSPTREVTRFANPNRHGGPLVFQALVDPGSSLVEMGWIPVLLPIRPNGTIGWVSSSDVELTRNPYRIEVDVDDFRLTVYRYGESYFSTEVGIGEGETPKPYGSFFLTDLLRPSDPDGVYGPYAYGLSGFSETLTSFNGGPGVIGIHGTNRPGAIGTRVSHGCIRVTNEAIIELSTFLPLGTPVVIDDNPSDVTG